MKKELSPRFSADPLLAPADEIAVRYESECSSGDPIRSPMQDPIRQIFSWNNPYCPRRSEKSEHELIEYRDRVEFALTLIRRHELRLWFEPDWRTAVPIAQAAPQCAVFSIPDGARIIDELDQPPPWRR
ncbi:MAG: hypothetical protein ACP5VE_01055 [Chthonomonadales bacterium]